MLAGRERYQSGTSPRQAGPLRVVLVNNSDEQAGTQGSFASFDHTMYRPVGTGVIRCQAGALHVCTNCKVGEQMGSVVYLLHAA